MKKTAITVYTHYTVGCVRVARGPCCCVVSLQLVVITTVRLEDHITTVLMEQVSC